MAKVSLRIGELLAQVFTSATKTTSQASMSIYPSTPVTCPLCRTKVKAKTLHKCQTKESK